MKDVVFVQLGRHGDIVNILPLMYARHQAGEKVHCVVHSRFASILEAVTYVTPIIWSGGLTAVRGAYDHAKQLMPDAEIIASQVNGAFAACPIRFRNFATESWYRGGGKLGDYGKFPLVFDAPREPVKQQDGVIRIGVSLDGFSSPFPRRKEFFRWLSRAIGDKAALIDLSIRLPHLCDLIPIIESCDFCILNDSLPLHISAAFKMPVIAIARSIISGNKLQEASWQTTEPMDHWLMALSQEECLNNVGQSRIRSALKDILGIETMADEKQSIVQVANWYRSDDEDERRRMERARDSWDAQIVIDGHWSYTEPPRHRSSRDLGDSRTLPFVKDMIDRACENSDIGVLTNSDILLNADAAKVIRQWCNPCCYSHRMDITPGGKELRVYPGIDLVAFQSSWWKEHRDEYPDFVIGCEGWDGVMSMWLDHLNPQAKLARPIITHEVHQNFWSQAHNVLDNIGQRWNRALTTLWMIQNNRQSLFGSGTCLIRTR